MNYTLHKLQEGFIATSDEEIKTGDIKWHHVTGLRKALVDGNYTNQFKVIAQQDQIDFSFLSKEEQKEIGWFDIEKLTYKHCRKVKSNVGYNDYIEGFQKAQELLSDRRFTLGDIKSAYKNGWSNREESKTEFPPYFHNDSSWGENGLNNFIQSLSQPKSWKIELEMEYDLESIDSSKKVMKPKLTNGKIKILKLL
jgi:hypothetical protein